MVAQPNQIKILCTKWAWIFCFWLIVTFNLLLQIYTKIYFNTQHIKSYSKNTQKPIKYKDWILKTKTNQTVFKVDRQRRRLSVAIDANDNT